MLILTSKIVLIGIILFTGALTVITDLKSKKIYNNHLVICTLLGLAVIVYSTVWAHENLLFHIINGLIAFVMGVCLFRFELWKGGDAKLFILYAFLMPPLGDHYTLFSNAVNLFACSFIAGTIILLPLFIKDSISKNLFTQKRLGAVYKATTITIFISWLLFPAYYFANYYFAKVINTSVLTLTISYLIFNLARRFLKKMDWNIIIISCGIAFGFIMRWWINPHYLTWPVLPYSILKIGLFVVVSACITGMLDNLKENHDRIPFAPLLFLGCVLSYTPFLIWIINFMKLMRR